MRGNVGTYLLGALVGARCGNIDLNVIGRITMNEWELSSCCSNVAVASLSLSPL